MATSARQASLLSVYRRCLGSARKRNRRSHEEQRRRSGQATKKSLIAISFRARIALKYSPCISPSQAIAAKRPYHILVRCFVER